VTKKEDILAISDVVEEWAEDNGIVAHDVEQFELAERLLHRFREERQAGEVAYQAREEAVLAALKELQRSTPYNALVEDLIGILQAADRSALDAYTEELAACRRTVVEVDAATNRNHEDRSYEDARCAVVRMAHAGADALNEVQELRREFAECREALAESRTRVATLEAILDGDPHQQATPEERQAWRRSAVRYADQLEEELAACRARERQLADALDEILAIDNTSFPDPREAATAMRTIAVCVDVGRKIGGDEEALAAYGGPAGMIEAAKRSCDDLVASVNRHLAGGVGMLPEDVLKLAVKVTSVADRLDELRGEKMS